MPPTISFTSTAAELTAFLPSLTSLANNPPSLYLDLEGINFSRHGSISLLTLFVHLANSIYIVDVHTLRPLTFTTQATQAPFQTLKSIQESDTIPKALFDVRNDSNALFAKYGVRLKVIHDIQLTELGTRSRLQNFVAGLGKCITHNLPFPTR